MSTVGCRAINIVLICSGLLLIAPSHAGPPFDLGSFHGRVVYLDFWASWCTPCRQSFPWMQSMQDAYQRQGLAVVAVNLDHDRSDAEQFLQKYQPTLRCSSIRKAHMPSDSK